LKKLTQLTVFVLLALVSTSLWSQESKRGPSTSEERARAIQIAKALRKEPLAPSLTSDREWLFRWMIEVPDISVSICTGLLGELGKSKTGYPGLILISDIAGQATFIIEHPDRAKDANALHLAGVESALDTYKAIREKDPKYKAAGMDELLQKQEKGQLEETVKARVASACKSQ
jgi:hypothetical protein